MSKDLTSSVCFPVSSLLSPSIFLQPRPVKLTSNCSSPHRRLPDTSNVICPKLSCSLRFRIHLLRSLVKGTSVTNLSFILHFFSFFKLPIQSFPWGNYLITQIWHNPPTLTLLPMPAPSDLPQTTKLNSWSSFKIQFKCHLAGAFPHLPWLR